MTTKARRFILQCGGQVSHTHTPGGLKKIKALSSRCRKRYLIILSPTADPREFTLDLWQNPKAGCENATIENNFCLKTQDEV